MNAKRQPDRTRGALLAAAFEEIHAQGFRAASLDNILKRSGVTKGALYYHFSNKAALGHAVVDEMILPIFKEAWALLRDESIHPIDRMKRVIDQHVARIGHEEIVRGCPINNLVQEMAGIEEDFRTRLNQILGAWVEQISAVLKQGQVEGKVRADIDPDRAATMIVASYEGCMGLAKCSHSSKLFATCVAGMTDYVEGLRAQ